MTGRQLSAEAEAEAEAGPPTSPPVGRQYLMVFAETRSSVFPLVREQSVIVGRGEDADLQIMDSSVSRRHARIEMTADGPVLTDLGSQNGSYVNANRIAASKRL